MNFIDRIDYYRKAHHNMTQSEFERQAGIAKGLLIKWRNGRCMPGYASQVKVARLLNITTAELMEDSSVHGTSVVTVFENSNADTADYTVEGPIRIIDAGELCDTDELPALFAVRVPDETMAPVFMTGDVVFVSSTATLSSGDYVLAVNDHSLSCRKLIIYDHGFILQPMDTEVEPDYYPYRELSEAGLDFIGKIVSMSRDFPPALNTK